MNIDTIKNIGSTTSCPVAVMVRDNKLLLGLRNYTPDKWKDVSVWTTPGGRCDEGESLEQTLRREVQEEVGITDFAIEDFIGQLPGAKAGDTIYIFYCTTQQDARLMEPEKFSEWRWVSAEDYLQKDPWGQMNPAAHELISEYLKTRQA